MLSTQSSVGKVAVLVRSEVLLRAVEAGARGLKIIRCVTVAQLAAVAPDDSLRGIVYEAAFDGRGRHDEIPHLLAQAKCPVLVALPPTANAVQDMFEFTKHSTDYIDYVVVGRDWVQRAVARMVSGRNKSSAVMPMLQKLIPLVPDVLREPVARAIVLTLDDADAEELARICDLSGSGLRTLFRSARVAPPHVWLGSLRAAHVGWGVLELGQRQRELLGQRRFLDRASLCRCVKHYTGHSLSEWRARGGFAAMFDECMVQCLRTERR